MYIIHIDERSIYSLINTLLVHLIIPDTNTFTCMIQTKKLIGPIVKNWQTESLSMIYVGALMK